MPYISRDAWLAICNQAFRSYYAVRVRERTRVAAPPGDPVLAPIPVLPVPAPVVPLPVAVEPMPSPVVVPARSPHALPPAVVLWPEIRMADLAWLHSLGLVGSIVCHILPPPVAELARIAAAGFRNVMVAHPWYDPYKAKRSAASAGVWARDWLRRPEVHGVAVDFEGWILHEDADVVRAICFEATSARKLSLLAIKATLATPPEPGAQVGQGYVLRLPGAAISERDAIVNVLHSWSTLVLAWIYGFSAADHLANIRQVWGEDGLTWPMFDSGQREANGRPYRTAAECADIVRAFRSIDLGVGLFQPHKVDRDSPAIVAARSFNP